jgi:hypothetical protein
MKLELGLSVFSKRETLLGIQLITHNGVHVEDGNLYDERVVELSFGIIFAIVTIGFVSKGDLIDRVNDKHADQMLKAIEQFEKDVKEMQK